jgi:hypothetical protein
MRVVLTGLIVLVANAAFAPLSADPYTWCAIYSGKAGGGSWQCWFTSYEQCRATASGLGNFCIQNPRNAGVARHQPPRRTKKTS